MNLSISMKNYVLKIAKSVAYALLVPSFIFGFLYEELCAEPTYNGAEQSIEENIVGTYPVEIDFVDDAGEITKKTVNVTITARKTVVSKEYSEAIDAHDFNVSEQVFNQLTNEMILQLSHAKAWNTVTRESVNITKIGKKTIDKRQGRYEVTFATENDTNTTICISITPNDVPEEVKFMYSTFGMTGNYWRFNFVLIMVFSLPFILMLFNFLNLRKKEIKVEKLLYKSNKINKKNE